MYIKILFCVLIVSSLSYGQKARRFFRPDYQFLSRANGFYKIHTIHKTYTEAKRICEIEGTSLFYPENIQEAHAVLAYWTETQWSDWVFIGVSALLARGVFETFDGRPIAEVYHNWSPGEPNNDSGRGAGEDCVSMRRDSSLNDIPCYTKGPFICKKSLESLEWNQQCNMPSLDYAFNKSLGSCYKFHAKPLDWSEAYAVCSAEQSHLAVINSQAEADYFVGLAESAPKDGLKKEYMSKGVHLGFHNKNNNGWRLVRGETPLNECGYTDWAPGQPDGGDREQCGSMFLNGQLNDIPCDRKYFFICEQEVVNRNRK